MLDQPYRPARRLKSQPPSPCCPRSRSQPNHIEAERLKGRVGAEDALGAAEGDVEGVEHANAVLFDERRGFQVGGGIAVLQGRDRDGVEQKPFNIKTDARPEAGVR